MPRPGAARTVLRNASTPARWPASRGMPRALAQRPFPSMMIATCAGVAMVSLSGRCAPTLNLHDFSFLIGKQVIDGADGLVGQLLDLIGALALIVLADVAVLFRFLQEVHAVAADMAHRNA